MNHTSIIVELVKLCRYKSYLELGVYQGETLSPISKIVDVHQGVDINRHPIPSGLNMFYGTTDEFFDQNTSKFDCIFIDADHKFTSVLRDFNKATTILNDNGMIILHDTNPVTEGLLQDGYCSDCYKINDYLEGSEFNFVTLPVLDPGLTIAVKSNNERYRRFV